MNAHQHPHLDLDHPRFRRSGSSPAYFLGRPASRWVRRYAKAAQPPGAGSGAR